MRSPLVRRATARAMVTRARVDWMQHLLLNQSGVHVLDNCEVSGTFGAPLTIWGENNIITGSTFTNKPIEIKGEEL